MSYLLDDRQKINALILHSHRMPLREIERRMGVSKSQVSYLVQKFEDHGTINNLWRSNHHLAFNPEERQRIIDRVLEKRSITLSQKLRMIGTLTQDIIVK